MTIPKVKWVRVSSLKKAMKQKNQIRLVSSSNKVLNSPKLRNKIISITVIMSNQVIMHDSSERDLRAGYPVLDGHITFLKATLKSKSNNNFRSGQVMITRNFLTEDSMSDRNLLPT